MAADREGWSVPGRSAMAVLSNGRAAGDRDITYGGLRPEVLP
jgi:hypothetical protein